MRIWHGYPSNLASVLQWPVWVTGSLVLFSPSNWSLSFCILYNFNSTWCCHSCFHWYNGGIPTLCFYFNWIIFLGTSKWIHPTLWAWSPASPGNSTTCLLPPPQLQDFLVVSVQILTLPHQGTQDPVLVFLHCLLQEGPLGPPGSIGSQWVTEVRTAGWGSQLGVTISEVSHFLGSGPCPSGVNTAKPVMASYYREVYWQGSILVSEAGSSAIRFQEAVGA